jgi:hypothetical protein
MPVYEGERRGERQEEASDVARTELNSVQATTISKAEKHVLSPYYFY